MTMTNAEIDQMAIDLALTDLVTPRAPFHDAEG